MSNLGNVIDNNKNTWLYSDMVKDHFMNPRNFVAGDVDFSLYDGVGEVGSPACGDMMRVMIQVEDNKIKECKWQTFGCASAIATTSIMSEMVTGMTFEEAMKIGPMDIVNKLGGLPEKKIHCSVLGDQALRKAIENFREKTLN